MPSPDPEVRRQIARMGGLTTASRHDPRETTAAARRAFEAKFLDETDPTLPMAERLRRADAAYRLYMTRLAFKARQARGAKREAS
jgi:hypothetical protein